MSPAGHLRFALRALIKQIEKSGTVPMAVSYISQGQEKTETTLPLLTRLFGCTDVLPDDLRTAIKDQFFQAFKLDLSDEKVGTYASAARRVDEQRRGETDLAL